jgi:hypothetical protein
MICSATSGCRWVGMSTPNPGELSSAETILDTAQANLYVAEDKSDYRLF